MNKNFEKSERPFLKAKKVLKAYYDAKAHNFH